MSRLTDNAISQAHGRYHRGDDYQAIAWDIANSFSPPLDPDTEAEDWEALEAGPDSDCSCKACRAWDEGYTAAERATLNDLDRPRNPYKFQPEAESWDLGYESYITNVTEVS